MKPTLELARTPSIGGVPGCRENCKSQEKAQDQAKDTCLARIHCRVIASRARTAIVAPEADQNQPPVPTCASGGCRGGAKSVLLDDLGIVQLIDV